MDFIVNNYGTILAAIGTLCSAVIAITSMVKALHSEKRVKAELMNVVSHVQTELNQMGDTVTITRQGIVQAFKDAVVTKDIKVSINNQVKKILDEELTKFQEVINKSETRKTQMVYWAIKVLSYTAAYDKLTVEQKTEIDELLAMIADDEKLIDTLE